MKKGIDLFLILVLLATIGLLIYFGMNGAYPVLQLAPVTPATNESLLIGETSLPTAMMTTTLIPTLVVELSGTTAQTPKPAEVATSTFTALNTQSTSIGTPVSSLDLEINTGMEKGNRIIQAIEAYRTAKGEYPSVLDDLSPTFLSDIPLTSTGQAYFYRLFDKNSPLVDEVYWVSFKVINQDHVACTYFKRLETWDCDFASP